MKKRQKTWQFEFALATVIDVLIGIGALTQVATRLYDDNSFPVPWAMVALYAIPAAWKRGFRHG